MNNTKGFTIDRVLISLAGAVRKETLALGTNDPSYEVQTIFTTAKYQLYSLLMDVIGEDEVLPEWGKLRIDIRNQLRAEQRQKLNKLFGKEK